MVDTDNPLAKPSGEVLEASLSSAEEIHGKDHPSVLDPLNAAAEFHLFNKNYGRAEELMLRVAAITGKEFPDNAQMIRLARRKLAWLKYLQGSYDDAKAYFEQSLRLAKTNGDPSDEAQAEVLRNLVYFFLKTGQLEQSDEILKTLLELYKKHNKKHDNYQSAFALVALSVVADARQDLQAAKEYSDKAAEIIKDKCAIGYTVDFLSLSEIINLYFLQERKLEALELTACTMLESEDSLWPHNPVAGDALATLAEYMRGQRKFKQAESIYKRAIAIKSYVAGSDDAEYARLCLNLGNMYLGMRKYADAEQLVKNAMKARVRLYGVEHPSVAACVETYATLLRKTKRVALANKLDVRAREIRSACVARLDRQMSART